jgi:hypothetical protein
MDVYATNIRNLIKIYTTLCEEKTTRSVVPVMHENPQVSFPTMLLDNIERERERERSREKADR